MNLLADRRLFLQAMSSFAAAGAVSSLTGVSLAFDKSPNEKPVVGVMGIRRGSRGSALATAFIANGCEIAYVCDVDARAHDGAVALVEEKQKSKPVAVTDFRKILDDSRVDILVCAAPNHWHAPAAIMGCKAGKHVYVEKPCSHTGEEGELAVAAARKAKKVVQMGSQRRTWPAIREGIQKIYDGEIGRVLYARTWYNNRRPAIGMGKAGPAPEWLNWELWQGPCTDKPFKDNLVHYNWHWHWHWGNGELGNNGIHAIDVARWGLQADYPLRVTAAGGKYRHEDDQETPDTLLTTFDFPNDKSITWEGLSWSPYGPGGSMFGVSFHGENGTLVVADPGYKIFDKQNKEIAAQTGVGGEQEHIANFLAAAKDGSRPNADIEEAHKSTLLCHLGNIAYRVGRTLKTDPANGHVLNDAEAAKLWGKEYRPAFETLVKG